MQRYKHDIILIASALMICATLLVVVLGLTKSSKTASTSKSSVERHFTHNKNKVA
ncbi:hypothetical protein [Sphingobacterium paludis]|uniref:Uncharacterized protein n=1 Tax=Sphingobacterium paludis TaxID=1476465 RepID=A0A4R7D190_9SPHI|nr:hypothetical protein [Sphingobacterium paludis]TDS13284.1 hypothetical protein B0I21_105420 [Sphingobacterium paludis]